MLSYRTFAEGAAAGVFLMKAPDVARLLHSGVLDLGLTGDEWLMEAGVPPGYRCFEARSYEASLCLLMAGSDRRPARRIRSAATPYPRLARKLLGQAAPEARIMAVSGSSEAMVPGIADACLDLVETGATAARNTLVIRESFQRVTTHLARSPHCDPLAVAQFQPYPARGDSPVLEAWTTLAALAQATSRTVLGTLVSCAACRPAALTVKTAGNLQILSGDRFCLGLGAGWDQPELNRWASPSASRCGGRNSWRRSSAPAARPGRGRSAARTSGRRAAHPGPGGCCWSAGRGRSGRCRPRPRMPMS